MFKLKAKKLSDKPSCFIFLNDCDAELTDTSCINKACL